MKTTTVPIAAIARTTLNDEVPEGMRSAIEGFAATVRAKANWKVRKKTLCELMLGFALIMRMAPEERSELTGQPVPDDDPALDEDTIADLLPIVLGAVLETLDEGFISSAEQAAVYVLSIQPEHQQAAEAWMETDRRNWKAVQRILKSDEVYAALVDAMEALPDDADDTDGPDLA